nr:aspartate aminotransferase family protein [Ardenticatena sp.]
MTTQLPETRSFLDVEERFGSGAYALRGLTLVRGEGARVWDTEGREYIDCIAGHGAAILGHAHPAVRTALSEQAARLIACPGTFANDVRASLLERLHRISGFARFFLCNSGAEAVEGALKAARLLTGRRGIVAMHRAFHGRTMGALSATASPKYRTPFEPLVPNVRHIPFGDSAAAEATITEETAAVILEPIQGEGGIHPADHDYLHTLRQLCDARGALLIFDEVQTGFGRTGTWFAFQHVGVRPDIIALAKGIANGVPLGAVGFAAHLPPLPAGSHGSTFGGNPLSAAAALATLDTLEREQLPERAARLGAWALDEWRRCLSGHRLVRDVRGMGLMLGIDLRTRVTPLLKRLQARGILALPAGPTVLRLLPPLIIGEGAWATVIETVLDEVQR